MRIAVNILLFLGCAFSQSYVFNVYDDPFVDPRDGQVYNLFKTESSIWFVDNLKFNSDSVHRMDSSSVKSYCKNNLKANCDYYGRLYFWDSAVNSCPDGWHLPNGEEWQELVSFLEQQSFLKNVFVQSSPLYGEVQLLDSKRNIGFAHWSSVWWTSDLQSDSEARIVFYSSKNHNRRQSNEKLREFIFSERSWHLHKVQLKPGTYMESPVVGVYLARCVKNKSGESYDVEIPTKFVGNAYLTDFCR